MYSDLGRLQSFEIRGASQFDVFDDRVIDLQLNFIKTKCTYFRIYQSRSSDWNSASL